MRKKCAWSNKYSDDLIEVTIDIKHSKRSYFVLPEYREELTLFLLNMDKHATKFLVFMLGIPLLMILGALFLTQNREVLIGCCFVVLGFGMFKYPFTTPQTVEMMGYGSSIKLVKYLSVIIVGIGVIIAVWG